MSTIEPHSEPTKASVSDPLLLSGTVTFVFTDIEGSTRLLGTLRDEYGQLLDDFYQTIGMGFAAHDGNEVDRAGDGLFHSFPSARRAVAAAVAAQLAMAEHEWPAGSVVRARMGLHTGEPTAARAAYFGMDIHRAARIAAAGHGGQILISGSTRELVASDLPERTSLADLGEHWLKDLAAPEHLYQVNTEGLPSVFAPIKSLVTLPNNLPRNLSSFVGRRADVEAVRGLMGEAPLVTLTGPGGVGKTRLGLQVAAELVEMFDDGAWLVELETVTDARVVSQQIATALGIAEASDADAEEALLGHLKKREALLILDNCEQVIDAAARIANQLLRGSPGLRILATSREALGVSGERMYPLQSLSLPTAKDARAPESLTEFESVRLFVERAKEAEPSFELDRDNAPATVEICRRLDGIPLAIELAAARVRGLSVGQIAERLDDRFRLLTGGSRTVMPRHQTLRAAIEWSFDLLGNNERDVLWRLAVFAGQFTLEAAEAVCIGSDIESWEVVDHLGRLVEKSLVFRHGDSYRMLETVRGYARERSLEAGESEGAYARHRDWYLALVRKSAPAFFRGPESAVWLDTFEAEHDNLRAALAWSLSEPGGAQSALEMVAGLWRFWEMRGYLVEGGQWLGRALELTDTEVSPLRAEVLTGAGILAAGIGDHAAAVRFHEHSLQLQEQIGDLSSVQYALNNLANAALHQGDLPRARGLLERMIIIGRERDPHGLTFALVNLADVEDRQGDHDAAARHYQEAIISGGTVGDPWASAYALGSYGQAAARAGEHDIALQRYEQALALYRQMNDERGEARMMTMLAELASQQGSDAEASDLLYQALEIRCRLGDAHGICSALERFSQAVTHEPRKAARILAAAAAMRDRTGARLSLKDQATLDQQLASLQRQLGDAFNEAWSDGRSTSLDEAMREAASITGR